MKLLFYIKSQYRFLIFTVSVVTVVALVFLIGQQSCKEFENTVVQQAYEHLQTIAKTESQHFKVRFSDTMDELKILAENPVVKEAILNGRIEKQPLPEKTYSPEQLTFEHLMGEVSTLCRLDANGMLQACYTRKKCNMVEHDYSGNPGVKMVLKNHRPFISDLFEKDPGQYYFSICYPVFQEEQFIGILRALINLDIINECLDDSDIGEKGYAWLIDESGKVISHPEKTYINNNILTAASSTTPSCEFSEFTKVVNRMKAGESGIGRFCFASPERHDYHDTDKLTAFVPISIYDRHWSLGVVLEYDTISGPIKAYARKINITIGFLFLFFGVAIIWFHKMQKEATVAIMKAQAAESLRKANKKLVEAKNYATRLAAEAGAATIAKSQFLANMSHEIRTPMNAIVGFSNLLTEEELTEEQKDSIDTIQMASQSLLTLINDILDFSKIEAGQMKVEIIKCSLGQLLDSINKMFILKAEEKEIEFKIIEKTQLPDHIRTDPVRLTQCLINLINNAIKFTNQGSVSLNVSAENRKGQNCIRFAVEDTGIGIPENKIDHIFKSFTQADASTTREYGGTGLGLAITKELIELLGGEISVSSQIDVGSVFTVIVPTGIKDPVAEVTQTQDSESA